MARLIFITGGVVSSLGKGLASAALGALLQARGYTVRLRKLDPYLNVDPGTMSPYQHGEVYVTDDGAETDLDLGHYERFTGVASSRSDNVTAGRVYQGIIAKERQGLYLGRTVQVIPHVTDAIKEFVMAGHDGLDFLLCEIGGTVGDIEGLPFFEAIRQLGNELGPDQSCFVHLTLVPYITSAGELKTKPTQHSVKELRGIGIQPDILLCRSDKEISLEDRKKIALFCNVRHERVIPAMNLQTIYDAPIRYHEGGFDSEVLSVFGIKDAPPPDLSRWRAVVDRVLKPEGEVKIAVVGKYMAVKDFIQVSDRSARAWRAREQCPRQRRMDRERGLRKGRCRGLSRRHERHPRARRFWRARHGRKDRSRVLRAQAYGPVLRHLFRHADGGDRSGAQSCRPQGCGFHGVRQDAKRLAAPIR